MGLLLLALAAHAEEGDSGFDFELFRPHADVFGYGAVPGASTLQNLQLGGSLWFDLSDDPVILVNPEGERVSLGGKDTDALVEYRGTLHAQVGMGISRYGSLSVDVPFVVAQGGFEAGSFGQGELAQLESAGVGDIQLIPKGIILDRDYFPVGLALLVPVGIPSGNTAAFLGEGALTVAPQAVFEWSDEKVHARAYKVRAAASGGLLIREEARLRDASFGNAFLFGAAAGYRVIEPLELTLELSGNTTGGRQAQTAGEVLVGGKLLFGDLVVVHLGGGTGIFGGVGSPDFRVHAGVSIAPSLDPSQMDTDRDNVADGRDKCPNEAEDIDGFQDKDGCPELDNDADSRADGIDQCPNDPEDDDGFMDNDGCPEKDNDKDGVVDADDNCPNEAGAADSGGCPNRDTDGDGLADELDRCPYDAEDVDGDRDEDGCPDENQRVVVEKGFIRISEVIYFDTGKATIQSRSDSLVEELAKVINDNPQIKRIRVEGHTDDVGNDMGNLRLSQARAEAVKARLAQLGVDAARLDAAGFGEMRPKVPNDSDDHRAENRRVEFIIVDQN